MARKKDQGARRRLSATPCARLLTRGLEGVRLRDIAEEAGVTPAAVLYYGDVDALTYETYRQAIERFSLDREHVVERSPTRGNACGPVSTSAWPAAPTTN